MRIFNDYWAKRPHLFNNSKKKDQTMSFAEKEKAKKQTDKLK